MIVSPIKHPPSPHTHTNTCVCIYKVINTYNMIRKIIKYSRSIINAYSLVSHEWWVLP